MQLSFEQKAALNRIGRTFEPLYSTGFAGLIQEQILDPVAAGNIGITADAWDVDAVAKGGGHFAHDPDTTAAMNFGYHAGRIFNGRERLLVSAGVLALSASATNFVQVTPAGAVIKHTGGFLPFHTPLYAVVTGATEITSITNARAALSVQPSGGITGEFLSPAGRTKEKTIYLGTVGASTTVRVKAPSHHASVYRVTLLVGATVPESDVDYWTVTGTNLGPDGTGTTEVLASGDQNTSKDTGGTPIEAEIPRAFVLHPNSVNLDTEDGEVIAIDFVKTGSAADLEDATLELEWRFED